MAEAIAEALVAHDMLGEMSVVALREQCKQLGIVGYSRMKKDEIIGAIKAKTTPEVVAVVEPEPNLCATEAEPDAPTLVIHTATVPEEAPKEIPWQDAFIAELRNVCENFDALPETNFLPPDLLDVVTRVRDSKTVEELVGGKTEDEVYMFINKIRQDMPRYQRDVHETVALLAKATPVYVDVDFI